MEKCGLVKVRDQVSDKGGRSLFSGSELYRQGGERVQPSATAKVCNRLRTGD